MCRYIEIYRGWRFQIASTSCQRAVPIHRTGPKSMLEAEVAVPLDDWKHEDVPVTANQVQRKHTTEDRAVQQQSCTAWRAFTLFEDTAFKPCVPCCPSPGAVRAHSTQLLYPLGRVFSRCDAVASAQHWFTGQSARQDQGQSCCP